MKKLLLKCWLIILLCGVIFSGCWDRRELESLGLVQALGLDLGPGGEGLIVTTMLAIPSKIGGGGKSDGGGGDESGVITISINAPTIYEGFNLINTTINREITLIQNAALLLGEELAKQGISEWVDTLSRFREMRRTMLIFVCRGKAAEVMKIQPQLEKNLSEFFVDLSKQSRRNGMFPIVTLNDFMHSFEAFAQENYAPVLSKYQPMDPESLGQKQKKQKQEESADQKPGGNDSGKESDSKAGNQKPPGDEESIRIIGTAVFKRDKMVGMLDIYESQVLQLLNGQFREAALTTSDPLHKGYKIAFRLLAAKPPTIKYIRRRGNGYLKAIFELEADILSIQSGENYTIPSKETYLGMQISRELKERITKVIRKAQKEYGSDIFGFGTAVRQTFLTDSSWNKFHWAERFPETEIRVDVKVAIRRVGVQFQPPKLR